MATITVICPLYNKEIYLSRTIESVISQTYPDWELIIVDDGSTDSSLEIAGVYKNKDPRIKIINRRDYSGEIRGANICRNIALSNSSGKYAVFLDADDLLLPNCLQQRIDVANNNPGYSLYVFNVAYCKGQDAKPYAKQRPSQKDIIRYHRAHDKKKYFLKRFLKFDLPWHTSGPIWDKQFLIEKGSLNKDFQRLQDPELHTRILLNNDTKLAYFMHSTDFDVLHRKDDDRVVWDNEEYFKKQFNAILQFIEYFTPILASNTELKGNLQGYLLEMEKLVYRYLRDNYSVHLRSFLQIEMRKFYRNTSVILISDLKFLIFRKMLNLLRCRFLYKLKIPGMLILGYKKLI